jgi:ATP-dependent helicase HrpA
MTGPASPAPDHRELRRRLRRLERQLPDVLSRDRWAARAELRRLKPAFGGGGPPEGLESRLERLEARLERSAALRARRRELSPAPTYDPDLPIVARREELIRAIREHPVVIVAGETGSGKTTQLPKLCLEAGRGLDGLIGCTQPRRIAATTVAQRIAEEFGEAPGGIVGYKVRFQEQTGAHGYIRIMTDGILLAEAQSDPLLTRYDTLIVDEAHERSLNIDFILGILRQLLKRRTDLKVLITSATIDTAKFAAAFDNAPVIEVSGRMYPVEVRYWPPAVEAAEGEEASYVEGAVAAVERLHREGPRGDMLVFMPTEQDIRETCELLEARVLPRTQVMPLYARLSSGEQRRVFAATAERKIIVATNVAETSITIPGIRYVVDTGLARIPRYSPRTRTTSLPVAPVSRSSADQRAGRSGRVAEGVCVRLYEEADYLGRPLYTPPEILRANLAEVLLRMIALKLGEVRAFPFIDPPDSRAVSDGVRLLTELDALDTAPAGSGRKGAGGLRLTPRGRFMARMPVDPRLSRMLLEAREQGCLEELLVIAAALSIQDPRERPLDRAAQADQAHAAFKDPSSDFVGYLTIWQASLRAQEERKGSAGLKRFCREGFLSFRRMREWRDIYQQLSAVVEEADLEAFGGQARERPPEAGRRDEAFSPLYAAIHRAVLSGFLANIAQRREKHIYRAAGGREAMLFPGSGLFKRGGEWIVAAELVQTNRLYARTAAVVDPAWIEAVGERQCRHAFLDPRWDAARGEVVADEQVSLFGLVVVPRRRVSYGPHAPEEATAIFLREALVGEDGEAPLPFVAHNRRLVERVRDLENRFRRRDLLVDEGDLVRFYRERLGTIYDMRTLRHRVRERGSDAFLRMGEADLLRYRPDSEEVERFPDRISLGSQPFPVRYRFAPGSPEDGVTVAIPAGAAGSVPPEDAQWLVPGLLQEKITALLRGLPKAYRRRLVPVNETAALISREMPRSGGSLVNALGAFVARRFQLEIPAAAWPQLELPDHLRLRIALTGPQGEELAAARDPMILQTRVAVAPDADSLAAARREYERGGLRSWDFGSLPETVTVSGPGGRAQTYFLSLAREEAAGGGAAMRVFTDGAAARHAHREGVAALLVIRLGDELKHLRRQLALGRLAAPVPGGAKALEERLFQRIVRDHCQVDLRREEDFHASVEVIRPRLLPAGRRWREHTVEVLQALEEVGRILWGLEREDGGRGAGCELLGHLRRELDHLVPAHFVELYALEHLPRLVRYLRAMGFRARRGLQDPEKERAKAALLAPFAQRLAALAAELEQGGSPARRAAVEELFWMVEEFKVSLFAQELGTPQPVSAKRLENQIRLIERTA